ncbi:DUF1292 domain-containing protein [Salicibibacter kimchii]|uniref:UPF0473 protein DT065_18590 n=1 Tax=Salicibibacter kimchii TaxID=2099786 RepID=A0A345C3K1_9BACI|nr:DUF1292 domain-containing protein [Salicibibacter kimchii]AXF57782.1 DUF1292 domain-containing protein [Salicibibacter kimchii]
MTEEENERVIIPDEEGNEHVFEILFTFDIDETEKSYMVVTQADEDVEEGEEVEIFAFHYEESSEEPSGFALYPIESDEEWEMVEEMIATMLDEDETLHVDGDDHSH